MDSFAGTAENGVEEKEQGPQLGEGSTKDTNFLESIKGTKGLKQSRWDMQPSSMGINPLEAQLGLANDPSSFKGN